MKFTRSSLCTWAATALLANAGVAYADKVDEQNEWFGDAKFGMFVHFQAKSGGAEFNPVGFDAKEWVQIAKDGGVKYIVLTSKHHAGFCIFDSALTEYDVMDASLFKRDIAGELADACKATDDLKLGFYYSVADYNHPLYEPIYQNRPERKVGTVPGADISQYMVYMYGQLTELCEKYDPCLIWFDGASGFRAKERKHMLGQEDTVDLLHSYGVISNSRLGDDDSLRYVDYLSMGDNQTPPVNIGQPFESAITMNEGWGYSAKDEDYKTVDELLERLVKIVGKGGNFLLNVAPNAQGEFYEGAIARFKVMGEWLKVNGEAIYETEAGPYPYGLDWGSITQRKVGKNTKLYLNVVDWPVDGEFRLDGLNNTILGAKLLDGGDVLATSSRFDPASGIRRHTISIPKTAPDPYVSVIEVMVEGDASMEQVHVQQNDGSVLLDSYTAIIHDQEYNPKKPRRAVDFKHFTVPQGGTAGMIPARMLSVGGMSKPGDALSWDFRMVDPGTYEVVVVSLGVNEKSRLRATVAGQTVERGLVEREKNKSIELSSKAKESFSVLGTVTIPSAGMQTLTLAVAPGSSGAVSRLRAVRLLPVAAK